MPKTITTLTEAQQMDLRQTYEAWLTIGRSTNPLDRDAAERLFGQFYARINEPPPASLFFSSPAMVVLAVAALRTTAKAQKSKKTDGSQLWSQLESQLESQLWSQLWSQLRSQLRSQLWSQLSSTYFIGDQWCAWKVFFDFCRRIGVHYSRNEHALLDLWMSEARTCHWWWPYKGLVLASERPVRLKVDAQGRLHSADGLAVGYSDGWGVYAWHGVRVSEQVICRPASLTVQEIKDEANAEIRRVMLARFGEDRFIADGGAELIHADSFGQLYRLDPETLAVRVENSTRERDGSRKPYWLYPHPELRPLNRDAQGRADLGEPQALTARNAVASTFGLRGPDYAPVSET